MILKVPAELITNVVEPSIIVGNVTAQITNLCAGDLEIILLTAIIISTFDRTIRRRIIGIIIGILLILLTNPIRIAIVLAFGHYTSWVWANFTHDILFRLTLIFIIVIYYYLWYVKYDKIRKLFVKNKKQLKKK